MELFVALYVHSQDEYLLCLFLKELLQREGRNWVNLWVYLLDAISLEYLQLSVHFLPTLSCEIHFVVIFLVFLFLQVGYKVRLEGMKGRDTHLLFCTTGILLRRLLIDRNLKGVTHVIVDEIHERGMNEGKIWSWFKVLTLKLWGVISKCDTHLMADFLLIVLKDLLPRRPELRLILMSATLDAELFSSYFGGAQIIPIPVRQKF